MSEDSADIIARAAARLLLDKPSLSMQEAISSAVENTAHPLDISDETPVPGVGRVRKHLQAMTMQRLGYEEYVEQGRRILSLAEEVMTLFSEVVEGVEPWLMGRAAQGLLDGPVPIHIRLYTDQPVEELAALLVEAGYQEPTFSTASSKLGDLSRIHFTEHGVEFILTRLPLTLPGLSRFSDRNLFSGTPIATLSLKNLRRRLHSQP